MKVKSESEVAQLCPTLSDPMDCSLPGSCVHGIFQARVLEWVATAFSKNSGLPIPKYKYKFQDKKELAFGLETIWNYQQHRKHGNYTCTYSKLKALLWNFC